jgi:hypothetical protein
VNDYFSDRENGPRARTEQVISPAVWAGLEALGGGNANGVVFVGLKPAPSDVG